MAIAEIVFCGVLRLAWILLGFIREACLYLGRPRLDRKEETFKFSRVEDFMFSELSLAILSRPAFLALSLLIRHGSYSKGTEPMAFVVRLLVLNPVLLLEVV